MKSPIRYTDIPARPALIAPLQETTLSLSPICTLNSDTFNEIFRRIDWVTIHQKWVGLTCKGWKSRLDTTDYGYDFTKLYRLSIDAIKHFILTINWSDNRLYFVSDMPAGHPSHTDPLCKEAREACCMRLSFLVQFANVIQWHRIQYDYVSELVIDKYSDRIDIAKLMIIYDFPEWFMDKHAQYVIWSRAAKTPKLSEAFIERHLQNFAPYWRNICKNGCLSDEFIEKHINRMDLFCWRDLLMSRKKINKEFLCRHLHRFSDDIMCWYTMTTKIFVSKKFLDRHAHHFDIVCWQNITKQRIMSEEFLDKYAHHFDIVCWQNITVDGEYSCKFLDRHAHHFDSACWQNISQYEYLTEEFMEKYEALLDWKIISRSQILPERLVIKHEDKVDWLSNRLVSNPSPEFLDKYIERMAANKTVSEYYTFSEAFMTKWAHLLDWKLLCQYQRMSETFIVVHVDKICWSTVSEWQYMSEAFIDFWCNRVDWHKIMWFQAYGTDLLIRNITKNCCVLAQPNIAKICCAISYKRLYLRDKIPIPEELARDIPAEWDMPNTFRWTHPFLNVQPPQ